ncbi:MAG: T9SS type A sorting domain-containing protein [Ignavibacteriae bacterium]|nr:T9SS type A sorting domain-containing protein [Ignavibacteriota bacterium]
MKNLFVIILFSILSINTNGQEKIEIGTNITSISDYMSEMPFVDLMHSSREWMTSNYCWISGGENIWNTEYYEQIPKDENGYPFSLPFYHAEAETLQAIHTIWASIDAWPAGEYTFLYDGDGDFTFSGSLVQATKEPGKIIFNLEEGIQETGNFSFKIVRSDSNDHVRNIRLLMPGTLQTYESMPFHNAWFNKLEDFKVIRFMDWGHTNNWGNNYSWECFDDDTDTIKTSWDERSKLSNYTWTTNKGVPYEIMIDLCNKLNSDMWICVPHSASDDYISQLATLLKENLNPSLKIYVEYSNETWNWMFGQTQWLNKFGCENKGLQWPEGIVPYIQNCMNIFSNVFSNEMDRIVRVVGVQAAWLDVSKRIVFNMRENSFDAFAPAAYFALSSNADSVLDTLGSSTTVDDIVKKIRSEIESNEMAWLTEQKEEISDVLDLPMLFYEGGQHITPTPFGEEPTYSQALLDIQRDTAMYNLYMEWFRFLETLQTPENKSLFMNFSFIAERSAKYGSWGILESLNQDTSVVPAPKYQAILDYINSDTTTVSVKSNEDNIINTFKLDQNYPNPFNPFTTIKYSISNVVGANFASTTKVKLIVFDILGRKIATLVDKNQKPGNYEITWNAIKQSSGVYYYQLSSGEYLETRKMILLK